MPLLEHRQSAQTTSRHVLIIEVANHDEASRNPSTIHDGLVAKCNAGNSIGWSGESVVRYGFPEVSHGSLSQQLGDSTDDGRMGRLGVGWRRLPLGLS